MIIDFVSLNVRCCDDPNGNSIEERAPRLKQILAPLFADVITLQEIRPKWVPEIEKYFSKGLQELEQINVPNERKEPLRKFVNQLLGRNH